MSFAGIIDIAATLALTALLAESYGVVRRRLLGNVLAPMVLGVLFGFMALVQMFHPLEPVNGLIIDMRNVPIALAGAFLGWRGLLPCLAIAMATRVGLGGVGMESGLWGMAIAGLAGMVWARKMANQDTRGFGGLLLLGLAMSAHLFAGMILPHDLAVWFFTTAAGPVLAMNLIAVPLIASLLERENRRIRRDNRLAAAATHDPVSGLLLGPAFIREMTNAFAAQPFGTFAGFLTITPEPGLWRSAAGFFGEPVPVALDRQALSNHMEHWELAGLCADGRVMIPLSREEFAQIRRVKSALTVALRSAPSTSAGTIVHLSEVEIRDPNDFLTAATSAAVPEKVDWRAERYALQAANPVRTTPARTSYAKAFLRDDHDALFAKADFLISRTYSFRRGAR